MPVQGGKLRHRRHRGIGMKPQSQIVELGSKCLGGCQVGQGRQEPPPIPHLLSNNGSQDGPCLHKTVRWEACQLEMSSKTVQVISVMFVLLTRSQQQPDRQEATVEGQGIFPLYFQDPTALFYSRIPSQERSPDLQTSQCAITGVSEFSAGGVLSQAQVERLQGCHGGVRDDHRRNKQGMRSTEWIFLVHLFSDNPRLQRLLPC